MKILPKWLREFVDIPVDDHNLADGLTNAGTAVEGMETIDGETVFEVEFTANRVDTMNHYGVARECAAIYDRQLRPLAVNLSGHPAKEPAAIQIEIQAPDLCTRYTAQVVRNVTIAPSPAGVAARLKLMESRSISNIADASNYTLLEMGHPTHCFDLDKLEGGKVIVRQARAGEKLRTLDGVERILNPEDLVIADASKPVALAGVMGGLDSMITAATRNVLIESAWFEPAGIRKTARRHAMHTEASHRFERGADIGITSTACALVAMRAVDWAGGVISGAEIDEYPRKALRSTIALRGSQITRVLGASIPEQETGRILRHLGFGITPDPAVSGAPPAGFAIQVPIWRLDVEREIDLVEEVARIYGFNRIPTTLPPFHGSVEELPGSRKSERMRRTLLSLGYSEAVSLAFISRADAAAFTSAPAVELANAVNDEAPLLRNSMLPGMVAMLAWNLNRGNNHARLFESGHTFQNSGNSLTESPMLCIGATGSALAASVHQPERAYSFFDLKGTIESLLAAFQCQSLTFENLSGGSSQAGSDCLHPTRSACAVMDGIVVARFGQIHPQAAAVRKLRQEVYLAEIDLEALFRHALREPKYREIPRYPAVERDFSFLFGQEVQWERIHSAIRALQIAELQAVTPVEIFRGGKVAAGSYSLLLRVTFQSSSRTLRDDEALLWSSQITQALEALGGKLRS
jgi:phenylalanyl-tRNA synthetase beta chain